MDEATRRLLALSTEQQGLVTRAQLFTIGLTKRQIDHAIDTERLTLVHRTVYRIGGSAITADNALAAGLLLTEGVASHRSAAHLLGLVDSAPSHPEISVGPRQSQRTVGLILHRSSDLVRADVIRIRGLRCTTATRTLIDLGAVASNAVLESALERALHQRLTTVPRLRARLTCTGRRPRVASLRRVLDLRTPTLAAAESELELLLWQILRRHRLPFRRARSS
jgi:predicted transcriptional regulator of viral defense system